MMQLYLGKEDYLDPKAVEAWVEAIQEKSQLKVLNAWVTVEQMAEVTKKEFIGELIDPPPDDEFYWF